jgi:iron(III) transport system ATP-binding protein
VSERLSLVDLTLRFGRTLAVENVSLDLPTGVIGCLLGPSGCGKTSILRTVAGFESPSAGVVRLHGDTVAGAGWGQPPEQRRVGMIFQDLALFPHLTVADNVGFGLPRKPTHARRRRVAELLDLVGLPGMERRYPHHLSGGQQQRVAIARALAPKPDILLLDEPFSSLDVALRDTLPRELRHILREAETTALLVTHDQAEAFAMADIVGVMQAGRLQQWDSAYNLYHRPETPFVADFIGQGTRIAGVMAGPGRVRTALGLLEGQVSHEYPPGTEVDVLVRPDDVVIDPDGPGVAVIEERLFRGANFLYTLELPDGTRLPSLKASHEHYSPGAKVNLRADFTHLVLFPRGKEQDHADADD